MRERREERARHRPVFAHLDDGRQVARIGVDRVAEQHELHDRHHDHDGEGRPVAPHLHQFFQEHGEHARPGKIEEVRQAESEGSFIGNCRSLPDIR